MSFLKHRYTHRDWILLAVLVLGALLSLTVLRSFFTSAAYTQPKIEYLDAKKETVMELAAVSTTASAALSVIPGDAGTPIAEKLADLSMYTLIVLCAVFLEKYLTVLTGKLAFGILIPFACLFGIFDILFKPVKIRLNMLAFKLAALGLLVFLVIPVSVHASQTIEQTYQESITETIENAKESSEEVQQNSADQTLWDKFISGISGGLTELVDQFQGILNNLIEATAVMIVTSCLIPVAVILLFLWLIRAVISETGDIIPVRPFTLSRHNRREIES